MLKKEEKNPVGRPKLADKELIKDSWCKIGVGVAFAFVFLICGIGVLTTRTPLDVLTFQNPNKIKGSAVSTAKYVRYIPANKVKVVYPERTITRKINADGTVTRIIPANEVKTIDVSK